MAPFWGAVLRAACGARRAAPPLSLLCPAASLRRPAPLSQPFTSLAALPASYAHPSVAARRLSTHHLLRWPLPRASLPAPALSIAVLSQYLYDQFNVSLTQAGALASVFGLANLFARPAGGMLSDWAAHR